MRHINPPNKYHQDEGIKLGLSRAQVLAPNFGYHTLSAIKAEMDKGASLEDAFEKYCDLNYIEIEAMAQLGLSRAQVLAPNFGFDTLSAIKAEIGKGATLEDAFEKYCELNTSQIEAMAQLGLSRAQVLAPNFGFDTLSAIKAEIGKGASLEDAFEKYCELTTSQIEAMAQLGLSRAQVLAPNFDFHTVIAIKAEIGKGATLEDAFEKYCDLTTSQIEAMTQLGLSRAQVLALNFGFDTLSAIKAEMGKGASLEDVFAKYCDLTTSQIEAMTQLGLSRAQVMAPNFGSHTLSAIKDIQKKNQRIIS